MNEHELGTPRDVKQREQASGQAVTAAPDALGGMIAQFINWEQATKDTIDFKKVYVDMAGDLIAGLVLSQVIYWHLPGRNGVTKLQVSKDGHLWIAKHRKEWWDEIRISPRQLDRALKILSSKNLVETARWHFAGKITLHVRLIWEVFIPNFQASILPKGEIPSILPKRQNTEGSILTKGENTISPNGKMLYTETTDIDHSAKTTIAQPANAVASDQPIIQTEPVVKDEIKATPTSVVNALEKTTAVPRAPAKPKKPKAEPLPWSALTKAMHEATPADVRPIRCNYAKHNAAARACHEAGLTPADVTAYVSDAYQHDPWIRGEGAAQNGERVIMYMGYISDHFNEWKARHPNGAGERVTKIVRCPDGLGYMEVDA